MVEERARWLSDERGAEELVDDAGWFTMTERESGWLRETQGDSGWRRVSLGRHRAMLG